MTLQQVFVISWYFKFAFLLWFFLFVIYEIREFSFEANKTVIELNRKKYYCGYLFKLTLIDHFDYYLCLCKRVKSSCIVLKKGWEGWWWGAQAKVLYESNVLDMSHWVEAPSSPGYTGEDRIFWLLWGYLSVPPEEIEEVALQREVWANLG